LMEKFRDLHALDEQPFCLRGLPLVHVALLATRAVLDYVSKAYGVRP